MDLRCLNKGLLFFHERFMSGKLDNFQPSPISVNVEYFSHLSKEVNVEREMNRIWACERQGGKEGKQNLLNSQLSNVSLVRGRPKIRNTQRLCRKVIWPRLPLGFLAARRVAVILHTVLEGQKAVCLNVTWEPGLQVPWGLTAKAGTSQRETL